jgi:hypothetical protein
MPFLQSSGAISIGDLNNFFPGSGTSLSNFYRGGGRVPSTKNVTVREPTSGDTYSGSTYWNANTNNTLVIRWNGANQYAAFASSGVNLTSFTVGSYTYFRGPLKARTYGEYGFEDSFYSVYRTSPGIAVINTGIPSSGQISLSQFYGAEKP